MAQPQPADYSLPGVMRYLQTEWQRNERDRIQWELERAEMKTRIAKLEGEKRGLQLLVENQAKDLKLLKSTINGDDANVKSLLEESQNQFDEFVAKNNEVDVQQLVDSRQYLEKCIQEVEYLLQSSLLDHQEEDELEQQQSSLHQQPPPPQQPQQQQQSPVILTRDPHASKIKKKKENTTAKEDWTVKFALEKPRGLVQCLTNGMENELIGGCQDGTVCIWKFSGVRKTTQEFKAHEYPISAVAVGQGGVLYTGDVTGNLSKWSLDSGEALKTISIYEGIRSLLVCDDNLVASIDDDYKVRVWNCALDDPHAGQPVYLITNKFSQPTTLGYFKGNVIVGYEDGGIEMFDADVGTSVHAFQQADRGICSMAVLVNYKVIVVGFDDGTVRYLDITTKEYSDKVLAHTQPVNNLCVTAAERHLVSSSSDSQVKIWNLAPNSRDQPVHRISSPGLTETRYICDNYIAMKYSNGTIKVYDTKEEY